MSKKKVEGVQSNEINIAFDTRVDHRRKGTSELHTNPVWGITLAKRVCRRVRFHSYGTVGYGPIMWVKSRNSGDILHGHDSQAGQSIACQLGWQKRRYQGRETKRTIFLLVETRRTNRQSSRLSVVTGMSSTIVTGSYWQSCTPRCLHK